MHLRLINIAYADVGSLVRAINKTIINPLILLLFAAAVVYFIYGVVMFLINADNDEKRATGKSHMLWGIVGMTIMIAVFGIMRVIIASFGIEGINIQTGEVDL
ncbi:hypothetical protein COB64_02680 [Candidatus Wolfebacteria bacterium]|nr:MAG: hypothetical protein COB64_02680 [Candidatus Wolfebacteria bacterium]